jgi:hypothetical protein
LSLCVCALLSACCGGATSLRAVWRWRLEFAHTGYRILAVVCGMLSVLVLYCEIALPYNANATKNISALGLLLEAVPGFFPRQVLALLPLLYICWCTYLCVFRIKLFGLLELSGNRCGVCPCCVLRARLRVRVFLLGGVRGQHA